MKAPSSEASGERETWLLEATLSSLWTNVTARIKHIPEFKDLVRTRTYLVNSSTLLTCWNYNILNIVDWVKSTKMVPFFYFLKFDQEKIVITCHSHYVWKVLSCGPWGKGEDRWWQLWRRKGGRPGGINTNPEGGKRSFCYKGCNVTDTPRF